MAITFSGWCLSRDRRGFKISDPVSTSLNLLGLKLSPSRPWSSPSSTWSVHSQWSLVFEVQQQTPESLYSHHSSLSLWTLYDLPLCSGRLVGCVHSGISIFTLKKQSLIFVQMDLSRKVPLSAPIRYLCWPRRSKSRVRVEWSGSRKEVQVFMFGEWPFNSLSWQKAMAAWRRVRTPVGMNRHIFVSSPTFSAPCLHWL